MKATGPVFRLVQELSRLPGVGRRTAERLAFHILRMPKGDVEDLAAAIRAVKEKIKLCSVCFNFTEGDPCPLCTDPSREDGIICVVEEPHDLLAVERSGVHKGRYHVLHGALSPLDNVAPEDLKVEQLQKRLSSGKVKEVIIATNPTVEGEATALYLARLIKPTGVKVTRIAYGVPMGGDLEFIDEATVKKSLEGRREM